MGSYIKGEARDLSRDAAPRAKDASAKDGATFKPSCAEWSVEANVWAWLFWADSRGDALG